MDMDKGMPRTGFLREHQVLALVPVGRTTWWNGVKAGRYPAGVKISPNITAWRVEDIRALIERLGAGAGDA